MIQYKVFINGTQLNNIPLGLGDFETQFIRDSEIYGIYTSSGLNLIFIGDGYCILRDVYESFRDCQSDIIIQEKCRNGEYETTFIGDIALGGIQIDYYNKTATAEILDKSPLSLISNFSDTIFDIESTLDVFNETLQTPADIDDTLDLFDELASFSTYTNRKNISLSSLIKSIVSFMTGKQVTFDSVFFSDIALGTSVNKWRVDWTTPPNLFGSNTTEVKYKNFAGEIKTRSVTSSYATHTQDVANLLLTQNTQLSPGIPLTKYEIRNFFRAWKHNDFEGYQNVDPALGFDILSTHIIEILEINVLAGGGVVVFNQESEFTDGARFLRFLNYRMLGGGVSPYNFKLTFKDLMTNLNKQFNCYFIATIKDDIINIKLEDSPYFDQFTQTLILDNVTNLKASFNDLGLFDSINISSANSQTYQNRESTYQSLLCGINNNFDANNDYIYDTVTIWNDLDITYTEDSTKDDIYMIQLQPDTDNALAASLDLPSTVLNYYNPYLSNENALYRHFNKFKGSLSSSPDYFYTNTSQVKRFKKYEFTSYITQEQYNSFIDTLIDNIQFKTKEMNNYFVGIIMEIKYTKQSGQAQFTILGE